MCERDREGNTCKGSLLLLTLTDGWRRKVNENVSKNTELETQHSPAKLTGYSSKNSGLKMPY